MIKKVGQTTVADIFSIKNGKKYRIPKYQREYTWSINDWNALFNDVTENDSGYFLGSYICVDNESSNDNTLELIDGQQRFSTLILLLTSLYEKLSNLKGEMDDDELNEWVNLKNELAEKQQVHLPDGKKKTDYLPRLYLQKQNMNNDDFLHILSNAGIITAKHPKPAYCGRRRIAKAYQHFSKLIDEKIEEVKTQMPSANNISILLSIVNKFEAAVLVGIEVDSNKDAYMLFESLNHRGVPLSALDLIKNTMIAYAEKDLEADNYYEIWKQILANVGQDDYSVQERFFRQYYNAFRDELNDSSTASDKQRYAFGYLATRTTLLDIYEKMIKKNYKSLTNDLLNKSQVYSILVNNSDDMKSYSDVLLDLGRISGAPSYLLLMYIISRQEDMGLSDNDIKDIIKLLVTFFVRRNVTDIPNTRKLTQFFIDLIVIIKELKGNDITTEIRQQLKNISAKDDIFENKLRGAIYDENPEATRFLLCSIEALHQTKEIYSDLWARDNSRKYIWTIEHIFPEGENIPQAWVDMIANGNKELAQKYRVEYVHTLGNLTVTGYNQNLSNMSFEQKKNRKSKDKTKNIGYKNGLYLNKDVVSEDAWTVDKIQQRTNKIVCALLDMFKW